MTSYEVAEDLKKRALTDSAFRKRLYEHLREKTEVASLPKLTTLDQLLRSLDELIMRDIRY